MQLRAPSSEEPKSDQDIVDMLDNVLAHLEYALNYAAKPPWNVTTSFNCTQNDDGSYSITDVEFIKRLRPSSERAE